MLLALTEEAAAGESGGEACDDEDQGKLVG
jgi:hypothetical protein